MSRNNYAHEEVIVSTDWASKHLNNRNIRFVEVDVDTTQYQQGHLEGAVGWNWQTQLQDQVQRDIIRKEKAEELLSVSGITRETTIVLYGDNNNWFAAYAFWLLKYYGHPDVRLIDGGKKKWLAETKPLSAVLPQYPRTSYIVDDIHPEYRAKREDVFNILNSAKHSLVDVRSADEFSGKILSPPGLPEGAQRGGHIPGAKNIPWSQAVNDDGTFKEAEALRAIYEGKGLTNNLTEVIAYCRIGERSAHTWFVLKYLLRYPNVRNYDGSWTEWGNLINVPIEKQAA
ncbi:MAG: sulfurtransferase [Ignavibacteriae bacterium]|nr:sulfurtransferase [Ignavibacteriota bacterium]